MPSSRALAGGAGSHGGPYARPAQFSLFTTALITLSSTRGRTSRRSSGRASSRWGRGSGRRPGRWARSRRQLIRHIIFPQALPRILPARGPAGFHHQGLAIVSVISIQELTFQGMEVMSATYLTFEIWITVAALYFTPTFTLSLAVSRFEAAVSRKCVIGRTDLKASKGDKWYKNNRLLCRVCGDVRPADRCFEREGEKGMPIEYSVSDDGHFIHAVAFDPVTAEDFVDYEIAHAIDERIRPPVSELFEIRRDSLKGVTRRDMEKVIERRKGLLVPHTKHRCGSWCPWTTPIPGTWPSSTRACPSCTSPRWSSCSATAVWRGSGSVPSATGPADRYLAHPPHGHGRSIMNTALLSSLDIQKDYFPGGKMELQGSIEASGHARPCWRTSAPQACPWSTSSTCRCAREPPFPPGHRGRGDP